MSLRKLSLAAIAAVALAFPARGENESPLTERLTTRQAKGGFFGKLEFRPSWDHVGGVFESRNGADLGYELRRDLKLFYSQGVNVALAEPAAGKSRVTTGDGRIELDANNVWKSARSGLTLDLQPRLELPTDEAKRAAGMLVGFKGWMNLTKRVSDAYSLTVSLSPTLYAYRRSGALVDGTPAANPVVDLGVEILSSFTLARSVRLGVPLKLYGTRYAAFQPGARNDDRWVATVTLKPELLWTVDKDVILGAAYETGNLAGDYRAGLAQLVFITNL